MPRTRIAVQRRATGRAGVAARPKDRGRPAKREPFLLVDLPSLPGIPCPCGTARRAFADDREACCSVHRVQISATAQPHYHTRLTVLNIVVPPFDPADEWVDEAGSQTP